MKRYRLMIALGILATFAGIAYTQYPTQYHHGHQPVLIQPGAVLPLYGAAYQPTATTDEDVKELLRKLLESNGRLEAEMKKIAEGLQSGKPIPKAKGDPIPGKVIPPVPKKLEPLEVVRAKCAACHTGDAEKGGGFTMYVAAGNPLKWSSVDRREMAKRVENGTMPPRSSGTLNADEKDAILRAFQSPK